MRSLLALCWAYYLETPFVECQTTQADHRLLHTSSFADLRHWDSRKRRPALFGNLSRAWSRFCTRAVSPRQCEFATQRIVEQGPRVLKFAGRGGNRGPLSCRRISNGPWLWCQDDVTVPPSQSWKSQRLKRQSCAIKNSTARSL
ncbi:uncharacterized protein J3D65DRAFT_619774 [Phyllosticta citribraziliensis]|uniref:Secreted protein n=1 Tax=Phyllosticta citribraziliensis TaxID=989973 RepID=A0ABR1LZ08_9PEZI